MYCCCCDCKWCCVFGIIGLVCTVVQFIIICCLLFAIYQLVCKRIAIEPVHHPDGEYEWALTKNGKPYKWLGKHKK